MKNLERFSNNLLGLAETFGEELSVFRVSVYTKALSGFDDDQVEQAMIRAAMTLRFFPKPSELIELIQGDGEEQALIAWEHLLEAFHRAGPYDSVLFADTKIARVIESMGGWLQVCLWPEEEMKFRRQEFLKAYRALSDGGKPRVLHGIVATHNAAVGYIEHRPKPVVIGEVDSSLLLEEEYGSRSAGMQAVGKLLPGVCAVGDAV